MCFCVCVCVCIYMCIYAYIHVLSQSKNCIYIFNRLWLCVSLTKISGFEIDSPWMKGGKRKGREAFLVAWKTTFLAVNAMLKPLPEHILHYVKQI